MVTWQLEAVISSANTGGLMKGHQSRLGMKRHRASDPQMPPIGEKPNGPAMRYQEYGYGVRIGSTTLATAPHMAMRSFSLRLQYADGANRPSTAPFSRSAKPCLSRDQRRNGYSRRYFFHPLYNGLGPHCFLREQNTLISRQKNT